MEIAGKEIVSQIAPIEPVSCGGKKQIKRYPAMAGQDWNDEGKDAQVFRYL
ncbi:hypothetical protein OGH69_07410 [Flavobacterium sp. MFBS3-15]|uniref:hypothetical protein n=1 Tax=Flavobacterium sp. MFBS3-15 TaxID=2989816 RepID=UPI002235CEC2|nr:hypothetical protein [Flavobacterium sp. MFBS3-15]MCW4468783.1 hypothetical protein [Flavobacterium sp. MFBS3-15]